MGVRRKATGREIIIHGWQQRVGVEYLGEKPGKEKLGQPNTNSLGSA
jgi:hypothetical protein